MAPTSRAVVSRTAQEFMALRRVAACNTSHHIMQLETQRPGCRSSGINTSTEDVCFLSSPRVLERFQLTCQNKVAHLVEALRYKPEGRGFDSRLSNWNFSLT